MPDNTLCYYFGTANTYGNCAVGTSSAAGADGNRSKYTDAVTGGSAFGDDPSTTYSYDAADRLIADSASNFPSGTGELLGTSLTSANLAYDTQMQSYMSDASGYH